VLFMAFRNRQAADGFLKGITQVDIQTKQLLRRMVPGMIAVIYHHDLDELAAEGLIQADVKLVINAGQTMSGNVPVLGPLLLLEQGIPIVEINPAWFSAIPNGCELYWTEEGLTVGNLIIPCKRFTKDQWLQLFKKAQSSVQKQLEGFIENTFLFAQQEKELVLTPLICSGIRTRLEGRHVLVVIRGSSYVPDLQALGRYIRHQNPVLIGVDGGADALIEQGHKPDLIVGDMDSVSDTALQCGAELIVHAYVNGNAPGLSRIQDLGLPAITVEACGTSEDLALLLAYDQGCERIITVGAHSHMHDFLEKGRQGMGSTVLVRMKVGSKLIDAKGLHLLIEAAGSRMCTRAIRRFMTWVKR
jgi:uncharacterized membrane-anchored protein